METRVLSNSARVRLNRSKSALRRALLKAYLKVKVIDPECAYDINDFVWRMGIAKGIRPYVEKIVSDLLTMSPGCSLEIPLNSSNFRLYVSLKRNGQLEAYIWGSQCRFHKEAYAIFCVALMEEKLNFNGRDLLKVVPEGVELDLISLE